ncbi:MAG TPA: TIGR01777 family oxidoreductase [Cellvibrio sp.]|nr:TIGR01777 family oxidoreductase [Cellvibrio sp.]
MDTHVLALQLMAAQGVMGAFDTLYHHELTETLAQRTSARRELSIHALRAILYAALFIGLSCWVWHGWFAVILFSVVAVEIVLTLWDFVVEDKTRMLPATERVTHTLLAINGGAFITLLALQLPGWWSLPAAVVWQPHGGLSVFLALCGIGVGLSGVRDALAALQLKKISADAAQRSALHFSNQRRQVLVTGATGFIGQLLVRELLANEQDVIVLSRRPIAAAFLFAGKVKCIASIDELPANYPLDVIINLAGARILGWRWSEARKKVLLASRVALTRKLVEWIARAEQKPQLLLSASAIGYYGIQAQGDATALIETDSPQAIFMSRLCQEWEAEAQRASQYGVNVNIMRFGLVLGHQGALPMMLLPIKLGMGGKLGSGKQWMSWIHVRDLLRGIAYLFQRRMDSSSDTYSSISIYNFTASEALTQLEFNQQAASVLHRPCIMLTPGFMVRWLLGEQSDLLLEGQRVIPHNLREAGFSFEFPTAKSALDDICG